MVDIQCPGPGPHDPPSGVIGEADRPVSGMYCSACPRPSPEAPTEVAPDIVTLANNLAALTEAVDFLILDSLGGL